MPIASAPPRSLPRTLSPSPQIAPLHGRRLSGLLADLPSLLFLALVLGNVIAISLATNPWLLGALTVLQAALVLGCQEAKHLCVHRSFLAGSRVANDAVGMLCAALFGVNFHAYRHFHLQHHRATCTEEDPEGHLYSKSIGSRVIWLLAPLELGWVAYHINRKAGSLVPASHRRQRNAGLLFVIAFAALMAVLARHDPHTFVYAYVLPMALYSWFDFLLTQAEHYGVPVVKAGHRRDPGALTADVQLPAWLSWLTLHRSLHRVHHLHPGLRWFAAPAQRVRDGSVPITYRDVVRRWMKEGPRLWLPRSDG